MAISVGSAVGAGFNLIGRRPLTVVVWGAILLVAVVIIELLAFALFGIGPSTLGMADASSPSAVLAELSSSMGRLLFTAVLQLPLQAIMGAAVMRAVLEPEHKGFASIRFGNQEVALILLALLMIGVWIVVAIVSFIAFVIIGLIAGLIGHAAGVFAGGAIAVLLAIAYGLVLMFFALRFSLAMPMTYAEGRVRFFGSWVATRGEGWRLFGLAWLLVLIGIGLFLVVIVVVFILALIIGVAGAGVMGSNPAGFAQNPAALAALGPLAIIMVLLGLGVYAVLLGVFQAIFLAPWPDVYRQLKGPPNVAATFS